MLVISLFFFEGKKENDLFLILKLLHRMQKTPNGNQVKKLGVKLSLLET